MKQIFHSLLILVLLLSGCVPAVNSPVSDIAHPTGISGQVTDRAGHPVSGAWVYAYRNTSSSLRGPADFGARTDKNGHYYLDLVNGSYYLIARWRKAGGEAGPPQAGDAWGLFGQNPLQVVSARISRADFQLRGVQAGQPVMLRGSSLSQGKTGFTGLLLDAAGKPLPGAFALAYANLDFRRMPDFTSAVVGADGRFQLFVPTLGRYCLAARTRTRGQPIAGEPYGLLGNGESGCLATVKDRLIDVGEIHLSPYRH
ncbi:carboxypeptidase regulatory-like domain-containing protein [Geopsychrobacter electrodiphilus]|uniref:carboxypeptidase regulatory-like domain-containing protein n=1 Tax=Geopsychrobacter electrodiphilus TaxID=225196 RepID=UPI0003818840|nr:carboxypeptidase regulatory-like domain-containing protein [Geopsychrobacter electrodiphilus]